jgi:hypothetical protein
MKMAFLIHNELHNALVMRLLKDNQIDYYTRWDDVKGKGRGTDAHLGAGGFPSLNCALMIAFEDEAPLERLVQAIVAANADIKRADDKIRLFQLPLERMV